MDAGTRENSQILKAQSASLIFPLIGQNAFKALICLDNEFLF